MKKFLTVDNFSRFALAVIYIWFGVLKLLNLSPATKLVHDLFDQTIAWVLPFQIFFVLFSLFEITIGVLFLIKKLTKPALILFALHVVTTSAALILVPSEVWVNFLVPTMEGQFIIKNIVFVALGLNIWQNYRLNKSN